MMMMMMLMMMMISLGCFRNGRYLAQEDECVSSMCRVCEELE